MTCVPTSPPSSSLQVKYQVKVGWLKHLLMVVFLVKVEVEHQKKVGRMMVNLEVGHMSTILKGGLLQVENQVKVGHVTSCQAIHGEVAERVEY